MCDVLKELVDALPQEVDPMYTWARKSNNLLNVAL